MAIIKFTTKPFPANPWTEFEEMKNEMERLAQNHSDSQQRYTDSSIFPALNISEDDTNLYVRAKMPGIDPANAEFFLEDEILTIKGTRQPLAESIQSYHRREIAYGTFRRCVTLPSKILSNAISATTSNGIITITLPKSQQSAAKKIVVAEG